MKKHIWKQAFLSLLAGSISLTGCSDDEKLNLPGYPETPVGIVIAGTENIPTVTVKASYEPETGALKLDGTLTRTYVFSLSTPSPEDAVFHVEKIAKNIPEDMVSISAMELHVPAGAISAEVTVELTNNNTDFMEEVYEAMTYEIGVRLTAVEGSRVTMPQSEAKVIVEKEAYVVNAKVTGIDGGTSATFKRSCLDGQIVNEDPIVYEFKVTLDKPALRDLTFSPVSSGTPEDYKTCESFSGNLTIAAGAMESTSVTWTLEDNFLEGNDDPATYEIALSVSTEDDTSDVVLDKEQGECAITVSKVFDYLNFLPELDSSWIKFDRTGWTTDPSSASGILTDNYTTEFTTEKSVVIDMQESRTIVGFQLFGYTNDAIYLPGIYSISTSTDGTTWTSQGELTSSETTTKSHIIGIAVPVTARYIKYDVVKNIEWYQGYLAGFEVYGKN